MSATTLGIVAAAWGVVMALSPLVQIRRMIRLGSSRDVSIAYLLVIVIGFGFCRILDGDRQRRARCSERARPDRWDRYDRGCRSSAGPSGRRLIQRSRRPDNGCSRRSACQCS